MTSTKENPTGAAGPGLEDRGLGRAGTGSTGQPSRAPLGSDAVGDGKDRSKAGSAHGRNTGGTAADPEFQTKGARIDLPEDGQPRNEGPKDKGSSS